LDSYSKENLIKTFNTLTHHPLIDKPKILPIGIDGLSSIIFKKNIIHNIAEIERKVQNFDYKYSSLLAIEKKEEDKKRLLFIPRVRDQIIFKVIHEDLKFSAKKSQIDLKISSPSSVLKRFKNILKENNNHVIIRTDINNFYNSIPRADVIDDAINLNPNSKTIYLLKQFKYINARNSKIMSSNFDFGVKGLPEGVSLSSSLSELWANKIDIYLSKFIFFRYVDDILILAKNFNEAKIILEDLTKFLAKINLCINKHKTQITDLKNGLFWLGLKHFSDKTIVQNNKVEKWYRLFLNKRKYFSKQINNTDDLALKKKLCKQFIEEIFNEINGKTSSRIFWYSNADNYEIWKNFDKKLHSLIKSIIRQSHSEYNNDFPSVYRKIKMIKNRTANS